MQNNYYQPLRLHILLVLLVLLTSCGNKTSLIQNEMDCVPKDVKFLKLTDFGLSQDCTLKDGLYDTYFVIDNCKLFDELMNCKCSDKIDFTKYTLIAGVQSFANGTHLSREKVVQNCNQVIYTISFNSKGVTMNAPVIPYSVVIEKPKQEVRYLVKESIWKR